MRVIAGQCKGRILFRPKGKLIRPTTDRTKKFIFDYLSARVVDSAILDLFAGTGSLSIEALSRGAKFAVLVDSSKEAVTLIQKNVKLTQYQEKCQIIRTDTISYLDFIKKEKNKFGLIFADPPYSISIYQKVLERVENNDILEQGGLFILEHDSHKDLNLHLSVLKIEKVKVFGDTSVTFFKKY